MPGVRSGTRGGAGSSNDKVSIGVIAQRKLDGDVDSALKVKKVEFLY